MKRSLCILALLAVVTTGCTRLTDGGEAIVNHMITIDREGNYIPIEHGGEVIDTRLGEKIYQRQLQGDCATTAPYLEHLKQLFAAIEASQKTDILIFIHGGLNTLNGCFERIIEQHREIQKNEGPYPIFINWRSGAVSTYWDHLVHIRQGAVSDWAPLTAPLYAATDLAGSLVNAFKAWTVTGEHAWRTTLGRNRREAGSPVEENKMLERMAQENDDIFFTGNQRQHFDTFPRSLLWGVTAPAKLVTTPFVYTLVRPAWDVMLRRSKLLVNKPAEFDYESPNNCGEPRKIPSGSGALAVFMEKLGGPEGFLERCKAKGRPMSMTLIAHSMGTIVAGEILKSFPDIYFKNIVFMGAAISTRDAVSSLGTYLMRHRSPPADFYNLSLHPENEDREISGFGLIPSGSLLAWIDNMYTTPETRIDRTFGRWDNIKFSRFLFPEAVRDQMHYKIFGMAGGKNAPYPQKHGEFDEVRFAYWKPIFWWHEP